MQLIELRPDLPYKDLVQAIAKNFVILLEAYANGANAMIFQGDPGLNGLQGVRGASLVRISDTNFSNAYNIIADIENFDTMFADKTMMLQAIDDILSNSTATVELFAGIENISTISDLVLGDSLCFSNARIVTLYATNNAWTGSYAFENDLLNTVTGMTREEINALIESILSGKNSVLTSISSVSVSDPIDTVLPAFDDLKALYPILSELAIYTYFDTDAKPVFLLSNKNAADDMFMKLASNMSSNMFTGVDLPRAIMIQDSSKYGMLLIDPANVTDELVLSDFANFYQSSKYFVIAATADASLRGKIKVSQDIIDYNADKHAFHGLIQITELSGYDSVGFNELGIMVNTNAKYIRVDGANAFSGNQSMGSNRLTNLASAVNDNDAVTFKQLKGYVQTIQFSGKNYSTDGLYTADASYSKVSVPAFWPNPENLYTDESLYMSDSEANIKAYYSGATRLTIGLNFAGSGTSKVAARSDHNHERSYMSAGKLNDNTNIDETTLPGVFRVGETSDNASIPLWLQDGQLLVISGGFPSQSDTMAQVGFDWHGNDMYWRTGNPGASEGSLKPWRKIFTEPMSVEGSSYAVTKYDYAGDIDTLVITGHIRLKTGVTSTTGFPSAISDAVGLSLHNLVYDADNGYQKLYGSNNCEYTRIKTANSWSAWDFVIKSTDVNRLDGRIGEVKIWPTKNPPSCWMVADHALVSKAAYPELFTVLGYTWGGSGDYFRLPYVSPYGTPVQMDTNDNSIKSLFIAESGSMFSIGNIVTLINGAIIRVLTTVGGSIATYGVQSYGANVADGTVLTISAVQYPNGQYGAPGTGATFVASVHEIGGEKTHTLTIDEMPEHRHKMFVAMDASNGGTVNLYDIPEGSPTTQDTTAADANNQYKLRGINDTPTLGNTSSNGGGQPHNNMQPFTGMLYCIKVSY
jgi:microcystin-dependent protein